MASSDFAFVTDMLETMRVVVFWQHIPKYYHSQVQLGGTLKLPYQAEQVNRIVKYWVDKNSSLLHLSDYQEMWPMTTWWEQTAFIDRHIDQLPVDFVAQRFPRYLTKRKTLDHPDFHWITVNIVPTLDWQMVTVTIPHCPESPVTFQYRLALGSTTCPWPPLLDTTYHPVCEFQLSSATWTILDTKQTQTDLPTSNITPAHFAARYQTDTTTHPLHCWHSEKLNESDPDSESLIFEQEQESLRHRIQQCLVATPDSNTVIELCRDCSTSFSYRYKGDVLYHPRQVSIPCHLNCQLTIQCFIGKNVSRCNLLL